MDYKVDPSVRINTYIVEQVGPALHGDTLEDGENSEQYVVELGDAIVWSKPILSTRGALWTQPRWKLYPTWKLFSDLTCTWMADRIIKEK